MQLFKVCNYGHHICEEAYIKPIFHRKLGLRWLQNAKEINTKNMKCTCPTPAPTPGTQRHLYSTGNWVCICYPTRRNLHKKKEMYMAKYTNMLVYFALGNAKYWRRVYCPTPTPDARYFAFWWNIGLRVSPRERRAGNGLCKETQKIDNVFAFKKEIDKLSNVTKLCDMNIFR